MAFLLYIADMGDSERYCLPRRRARHRDKVALYVVLLAIYIGVQIVTGANTSPKTPTATTTTKVSFSFKFIK